MNWQIAFKETVERFDLLGTDISRRSGVDTFEISKFKNGHKDIGSKKLGQLMSGLETKHQLYMFSRAMLLDETKVETQLKSDSV